MRLQFSAPAQPVELTLTLLGHVVLVDFDADAEAAARAHLAAVGVSAEPERSGGLRFPVVKLPALADLSEQVSLVVDDELKAMVDLVKFPPPPGQQATVDVGADDLLRVRWFDGNEIHDVRLPSQAVPAFLATDLSFSASQRAWEFARSLTEVAPVAGRCEVNLDGFVEIAATRPQLVERAPVPGLFRLDEHRFGVPLAFADHLSEADGFLWRHRPPPPQSDPSFGPVDLPPLADHVRTEAFALADHLARRGAAVCDWPAGFGRRIMLLAALAVADGWPALVVCEPSTLWLWRRHAELFGLDCSLRARDAQLLCVTYRDVAAGVTLPTPSSIVFDDLTPRSTFACQRLAGVADAFRVAFVEQWPDDARSQMELMSAVRPVEFRADMNVDVRYPLRGRERLAEHVAVYRRPFVAPEMASGPTFRRSSVMSVKPSDAQTYALREAASSFLDGDDPVDVLSSVLQVMSSGTDQSMSSKLAAAVEAVNSTAPGASVCVTVRSPQTATLLELLTRPRHPQRWVPGGRCPAGDYVVWAGFPLPDLSGFDEVVVVDYPRSFAELDAAVGPADSLSGPSTVRVVHLESSPDDRLAVLAMLRAEGLAAPLGNLDGSWSAAEAEYLLS